MVDVSQPEHVMTIIVLVGATLAAIIGIWRGLRGIARFFEKVNRFFEDWYGSPAEDGHVAKKGVLHRLDDLERRREDNTETLSRLETKMDDVVHEVTNNDGSSLKDSIYRIEIQQQEEVLERKSWEESYSEEQRNMRLERAALHHRIGQMIGKSPEEQNEIWDGIERRWTDGFIHDTPEKKDI